MAVLWLDEISAGDLETVGGKGASLGELTGAGLPVPPGFVVTAGTYRSFIEGAGIDDELFESVDIDANDSSALADAADRAQELIIETPFPDELREEILAAYHDVGTDGEAFVAVRSSATAEDLPDASFAGQQETFLNVTEDQLLNRVRECWASLFTQRAIYYRQEQGFDHATVNIAVVVQQMVDAEKSGVMFTSHPSTGDPTMIIEAAWGLGEAVVSGAVSPDNYVVPRDEGVTDVTVAEKKVMHLKDPETGKTVERDVPDDKRNARVVSDEEIDQLVELGERVENHYDEPQDVEWAMVDGEVFMLQSRPITTIDEAAEDDVDSTAAPRTAAGVTDGSGSVKADQASVDSESENGGSGEILVDGLGSSPGIVSGPAKIVKKLDDLAKVSDGDIIVTEMTMPDMVPAMKRASGIITDEGGMTSHAAIVSRELGVPAIVGTTNATTVLEDGQAVTLDGEKGAVLEGTEVEPEDETEPVEEVRPQSPVKPMTATEVKVNVSIPEAAERAAATGADGVGLLRTEHMILSLNQTPEKFIEENSADAYITELLEGIRSVADEFYPRPVRVRTLDAPTDEFRQLEGGEDEPKEHNPMLGYRGIRRSIDRTEVFGHELEAFRRLYDLGYDNVEIMFPLVNDAEDVYRAKQRMIEAGIDPDKRKWGVMIETPASALCVEEMAATGIDFASFGTNDLTQYTLAVDRNNEHVADRFDELHPGVLRLIGDVIETCREHDVDTSICGQAGSKPDMVQFLVNEGVSSISANIDAVRDVQHEVKRVEQKLLLESVR
ncbi:phosphoenolpyruvate synthase [Natrarchaeobius halalkaliphilus]|uniref:Phosphoenolpyruvate synthase n=1 Tax=Natrarchaeobius halalkaliphilus TaxID=1679091 RepID=A0A3N6N0P7_9EURY|nr:phosphoenolpyruvate synthase [Natrarchaeobius halalkaliphilus]RQG91482.1 phosphoenolpyruvate synthase [Natrarchaeobius halalkaliphilus]